MAGVHVHKECPKRWGGFGVHAWSRCSLIQSAHLCGAPAGLRAPGAVSLPLAPCHSPCGQGCTSALLPVSASTRARDSCQPLPPHPGRHLHNIRPLARPPAPHAIPTPPTITTLSRTHHGPHPRGVTLPPALGSEPPEESARSQEPGWGRTQPPTFLHT